MLLFKGKDSSVVTGAEANNDVELANLLTNLYANPELWNSAMDNLAPQLEIEDLQSILPFLPNEIALALCMEIR